MATPARTPYAVAARDLLRHTLLDAARTLLADRPWSSVTMSAVAEGAGVSRQTLYNEFGSRDEFARAYVLREVDAFLDAVEQAIDAHAGDPTAALTAALDVFLTAAADHPLVQSVVSGDSPDSLLPLVTTEGKPVIERAAERLSAIVVSRWPQVEEADARLLAEGVARLGVSYAALPSATTDMTAASIATLLGPYIERLVLGPSGPADVARPT
jgi:AcrR family transcriptional regulator